MTAVKSFVYSQLHTSWIISTHAELTSNWPLQKPFYYVRNEAFQSSIETNTQSLVYTRRLYSSVGLEFKVIDEIKKNKWIEERPKRCSALYR